MRRVCGGRRLGDAGLRWHGRRAEQADRPDLYDRIVHNMFSINIVWTLVTGFLVMFMQAGLPWSKPGSAGQECLAHV